MEAVYIIHGFLGSGKTEFIKMTLEQPYFRIGGTTLLLVCEEGEVEYSNSFLAQVNAIQKSLKIQDSPRAMLSREEP